MTVAVDHPVADDRFPNNMLTIVTPLLMLTKVLIANILSNLLKIVEFMKLVHMSARLMGVLQGDQQQLLFFKSF